LPDGHLLIVSGREGLLLRRKRDGTLVTHADLRCASENGASANHRGARAGCRMAIGCRARRDAHRRARCLHIRGSRVTPAYTACTRAASLCSRAADAHVERRGAAAASSIT
jgi:hypothetical protein